MRAESSVAVLDRFQCPWCRSEEVASIEVLDLVDHGDTRPTGRGFCSDCRREAPLVPYGRAC